MESENPEKNISEWKSAAEESKSKAVRYCRDMSIYSATLEETQQYELRGTYIESHLVSINVGANHARLN